MVLRTAREHVDLATTARVSVLDPHRRPLRRVRRAVPLLELPPVALRQRRAHVALVLHRARQDRRARATRRTRLLLALRDHDLVLDVVVHHVHLVLVRLLGMLRVGGQGEHDAWAPPERRLRLVVDADAREVHALLVDRGPALHEVSGDLHAGQQLWEGSMGGGGQGGRTFTNQTLPSPASIMSGSSGSGWLSSSCPPFMASNCLLSSSMAAASIASGE